MPDSWEWTTVGEICFFENGYAFSSDDYTTSGIPLIRISNIKDNQISTENCVYIQGDYEDKFQICNGDLLIAMSGATTGKMGIYLSNKKAYLNQRVGNIKVIDSQSLCLEYRNLFLRSKSEEILKLAYGGAQPNISGTMISSLQVPLPPISEQYRIVAETERWFALIELIEQGKVDLQTTIKQAKSKILDLAIHGKLVPQDPNDEPASELLKRINPKAEITCDNGQYGKIPDGWCLTRIKNAFLINPRNKAEDENNAGFVPMTNICDGYFNRFTYETKKWAEIKTGFTHFADGDIAVAKISPCLENRKSMVLNNLPNGIGAGTTELHVFRPLCVAQSYGLWFFKSDYFVNQCVGTFNGVVGQQRVGKNIVEDILFPLPPLPEQHRIVAKIEELFSSLDNIQKALEV